MPQKMNELHDNIQIYGFLIRFFVPLSLPLSSVPFLISFFNFLFTGFVLLDFTQNLLYILSHF